MTTDDFTEAARAEAEAVMGEARERVGITVREQARYIEGHVAGAEWGHEQALAQEPTDAEVEAVKDIMRLVGSDDLDVLARRALSAARAARRDEEKR